MGEMGSVTASRQQHVWDRSRPEQDWLHRQIAVLHNLARTEVQLAATFERLAASGDPRRSQHRLGLAAEARDGAARAVRRALELQARQGWPARDPLADPDPAGGAPQYD